MFMAFGWLSGALGWAVTLAALLVLGFLGAPLFVWTVVVAVMMWSLGLPMWLLAVVLVPMVVMNLPPLRRVLVSDNIMRIMDAMKLMPVISDTERVALEAGTTWVDAELFSGKPNFDRIRKEPYGKLSADTAERTLRFWQLHNKIEK